MPDPETMWRVALITRDTVDGPEREIDTTVWERLNRGVRRRRGGGRTRTGPVEGDCSISASACMSPGPPRDTSVLVPRAVAVWTWAHERIAAEHRTEEGITE